MHDVALAALQPYDCTHCVRLMCLVLPAFHLVTLGNEIAMISSHNGRCTGGIQGSNVAVHATYINARDHLCIDEEESRIEVIRRSLQTTFIYL